MHEQKPDRPKDISVNWSRALKKYACQVEKLLGGKNILVRGGAILDVKL